MKVPMDNLEVKFYVLLAGTCQNANIHQLLLLLWFTMGFVFFYIEASFWAQVRLPRLFVCADSPKRSIQYLDLRDNREAMKRKGGRRSQTEHLFPFHNHLTSARAIMFATVPRRGDNNLFFVSKLLYTHIHVELAAYARARSNELHNY